MSMKPKTRQLSGWSAARGVPVLETLESRILLSGSGYNGHAGAPGGGHGGGLHAQVVESVGPVVTPDVQVQVNEDGGSVLTVSIGNQPGQQFGGRPGYGHGGDGFSSGDFFGNGFGAIDYGSYVGGGFFGNFNHPEEPIVFSPVAPIGETGGGGSVSSPSKTMSNVKAGVVSPLFVTASGVQALAAAEHETRNVLAVSAAASAQNAGAGNGPVKPMVMETIEGFATSPVVSFSGNQKDMDGANFVVALLGSSIGEVVALQTVEWKGTEGLPGVVRSGAVTETFLIAEACALAKVANSAAARIYSEKAMMWWEMAGFLGTGVLLLSVYGGNMRSVEKSRGVPG
jgi:hypothetical protein